VGYANTAIAWHYAKLTLVISLVGVTIGALPGHGSGHGMASLYGEFYSFPFLVFSQEPDLYVISTLVTFAAALVGATNAISGAVRWHRRWRCGHRRRPATAACLAAPPAVSGCRSRNSP
jgi:putative ABC transport system permease protein